MITLIIIICLFLFPIQSLAAGTCGTAGKTGTNPYTADSASQTDVAACIGQVVMGDTINVPVGTVTWSSSIVINNKSLNVIGAGKTQTKISGGRAFTLQGSTNASRISGFEIDYTGATQGIQIEHGPSGWRIDNCKIINTTSGWGYGVYGWGSNIYPAPAGLIDNCELVNARILFYGENSGTPPPPGSKRWSESSAFGTGNAVYVEDCIFTMTFPTTQTNTIDSNLGGLYVYRYNQTHNMYIELHDMQASGRGSRSIEVYRNTLNLDVGQSHWMPIRPRGGSVIIFGNELTGAWNYKVIFLDGRRQFIYYTTSGLCDGSSLYDGNAALSLIDGHGDTGGGTATANDATGVTLTADKTWTPNSFFSAYTVSPTGTHTGADSITILTKAGGTNWTADLLRGLYVRNTTDGSGCVITANTTTTATCTLVGGSDGTWQAGDAYSITRGITVWNLTTGAKEQIYANSATTVTSHPLSGGWTIGDSFKVTNGWPCRDQMGRGQDEWLWTAGNPYPPQASQPSYMWLNRDGANIAPVLVESSSAKRIKNNRDFYDEVASFDGSSGTGSGLLANLPATCTTGVAYWATDQGNWNTKPAGLQGVLYKCTATDTWTSYYTPYQYPHLLRGEGTTPPPVMGFGTPSGPLGCTSNPRDVSISINTDQAATCKWSLTNQAYADMPNTFSTTGGTYHLTTLSSLNCLNSYNRYVRCSAGGSPNTESYLISFSLKGFNVLSTTGGSHSISLTGGSHSITW